MRNYDIKLKEPKLLVETQDKWIRGLNTLVSGTQIRADELESATDIQLVEDGKIQCPRDGQDYYGNSSGSRVTGLYPFYKSDDTVELIRTSGTALQKLNTSTNDWNTISGKTYTSNLNTEGVMAYDKLFLCNGTDALTYYDGTDITTFTEISAPSAPTPTRTGSAGSFTFSYKITALNGVGETIGSSAGSTTLNQSELDETSYITVTWSSVTNATGYNIYGRKDGKWYYLATFEGNGSTTYVDKGQDTPYEAATPPEGNSTGGQKGSLVELYKDSLFIAGDPNNPSRLYYSGGGDQLTNFTVGEGGGFVDINKNDGQKITAVQIFKNSLLVFKEDSVYQFSFTATGLPQVELVTGSVGAISGRSVVAVENDIFFASRRGVFSLGNSEGFAFDVLRTNEISAKVRSIFQSIATSKLPNISAVYATHANVNLVIFSYAPTGSTTNSEALVWDRERLAWYKWTNIQANCWSNYVDGNGESHVLYGDDNSGYVKEILTADDDFGSAIQGSFKLKANAFKPGITTYKKLKDISLVLREPQGSINLAVIIDGTTTALQTNVNTISPSINFAHYTFTDFLFGDSFGSGAITTSDDIVLRTKRNLNIEGRTFSLELDNGGSGASFTLLTAEMTAKPRSQRFRRSGDIIS